MTQETKESCVWQGDPVLIEYKNEKTDYHFYLSSTSNWGNPWDHTLDEKTFKNAMDRWLYPHEDLDRDFFKVDSPEQAAENFRKWLFGEDFKDIIQRKRKWLLLNIKYLKGKKVAFDHKPYAEILVEAIDKNIKIPDIDILPSTSKPKQLDKNKPKKKSIF